VELADRTFSLPVRIATLRGLPGLPQEFAQPEYAASVGLLLYGAKTRRQGAQRPATFVGKLKAMFAGQ
jgi:cell division ATPase FtsA